MCFDLDADDDEVGDVDTSLLGEFDVAEYRGEDPVTESTFREISLDKEIGRVMFKSDRIVVRFETQRTMKNQSTALMFPWQRGKSSIR